MDRFGRSLAWGDFNGDGYADLSIGMPNKTFPDSPSYADYAGAVLVIYGSTKGLPSTGSQFWRPGVGGLPGVSHDFQHFGAALASGDFNGDGYADLTIGVPGQDLDGIPMAGQVVILLVRRSASPPRGPIPGTRGLPESSVPMMKQMNSAPPWPRGTSTGTATPTWPSACPGKIAPASATADGWPSSMGQPQV